MLQKHEPAFLWGTTDQQTIMNQSLQPQPYKHSLQQEQLGRASLAYSGPMAWNLLQITKELQIRTEEGESGCENQLLEGSLPNQQ